MADPFATVSDLETGWQPLSDSQKARAGVLLARASVKIRNKYKSIGRRLAEFDTNPESATALDPEVPKMIVCEMVKRVLIAAPTEGFSQFSETSGPFTDSATVHNPGGDMFILKTEHDDLKPPRRAFSFDTSQRPAEG